MNYIGIDIGGTKCAVCLGNENGDILKKVKFATTTPDETLQKIFYETGRIGNAEAIGISCGGPLDAVNGIIQSPPNLPGWDDVRITEALTKKFGIPAFLCNDANACALAEWRFGAGRGCDNIVFLTFGTGLGAGLILNGRLYNGANGMAGEVGHVRLCEYGGVGYGKSGSFEGFCSGNGIAQLGRMKALEKLQMGETTAFCKNHAELNGITAELLARHADMGDETALEIYRSCGEKLGLGLSMLIDILNPDKIILGSIFVRCHHLLWKYADSVMKRECLAQSYNACKVERASLGEAIGDYAALSVAMNGREER